MQNFYCISSRVENSGKLYGCFKIGPLNQSLTFANALRRTLLAEGSPLEPQAIGEQSETYGSPYVAIQIYGIEHEFSTLLGVRESVLDIIANLEAVRFQTTKPLTKPKIAFCNFSGPGLLQAKHIHFPSGLKCVQPSQYIATVEIDGKLIFKLFFSSTKLKTSPKRESNFLVLQTPPSIVEKVNYTMLSSGALFFEVWTNGSMHPQNAILNATNKLLLEIFPYSKKISKISRPFLLNEKLLNLEVSNFYFNLETYLFFKKKGIHRIIDFLNFLKKNTDIDIPSLTRPLSASLALPIALGQRPRAREAEAANPRPSASFKGRASECSDTLLRSPPLGRPFKARAGPPLRGEQSPTGGEAFKRPFEGERSGGEHSIFKFSNYIANINIDPKGSILINLQQEYELRRNSMLFQFHQEDSEQVQQHVLE